jgi:hypothetical protein
MNRQTDFMDRAREYTPLLVSFSFFLIVLLATFQFQPGWGFMDDHTNLGIADTYQKSVDKGSFLIDQILADTQRNGRFRPIYFIWVNWAYSTFTSNPTALYLLMLIVNYGALFLWGRVILKCFVVSKNQHKFTLCIYPLLFFVFTPFWNIFMYISLQEKFIYWLSPLAILSFIRLYERKHVLDFLFFSFFMTLIILSKETGIALFISFIFYSALDLIFLQKHRKLSTFILVVFSVFSLFYYFFIKFISVGYTKRYGENLDLISITAKLLDGPIVIQLLLVMSAIVIAFWMLRLNKSNTKITPYAVIVPLYLGFYIACLSPWGFVNYLMAPIAPLIFISVFPVYDYLYSKLAMSRICLNILIVIPVFGILITTILPRIEKMADKRTVVEAIRTLASENKRPKFYYPPPMSETALHLGQFSGVEISYIENLKLDRSIFFNNLHTQYLVLNDESYRPQLENVFLEKRMYENSTWAIYLLSEFESEFDQSDVQFRKTAVQLGIERIKKM